MSINFYQSKNKSPFKNVFFARAGAKRENKKAALKKQPFIIEINTNYFRRMNLFTSVKEPAVNL